MIIAAYAITRKTACNGTIGHFVERHSARNDRLRSIADAKTIEMRTTRGVPSEVG